MMHRHNITFHSIPFLFHVLFSLLSITPSLSDSFISTAGYKPNGRLRPYCGNYCHLPLFRSNYEFKLERDISDEFDSGSTRIPVWAKKWRVQDPRLDNKSPSNAFTWYGRQPSLYTADGVYKQWGAMKIEARGWRNTSEEGKKLFDYRPTGQRNGERRSLEEMGYWGYTTGMVEARRPVKYGYFEVRAKPIKDKIVSGVWMSANINGGDWTELDLMESAYVEAREQKFGADMRRRVVPNAHVFRNESAGISIENIYTVRPQVWVDAKPLADQYKVYALDWNPRRITWLVDGFPYVSVENKYWHSPLYVKFDVETNAAWHGVMPDIETMGRKTFNVDYIRVYSYRRRRSSKPEVDIQGTHLNQTAFEDLINDMEESALETPSELNEAEGAGNGTSSGMGYVQHSAEDKFTPLRAVISRDSISIQTAVNAQVTASMSAIIAENDTGSSRPARTVPLSPLLRTRMSPSASKKAAEPTEKNELPTKVSGTTSEDAGIGQNKWYISGFISHIRELWRCNSGLCVKSTTNPWHADDYKGDPSSDYESDVTGDKRGPDDLQAEIRPPFSVDIESHDHEVLQKAPFGDQKLLQPVKPPKGKTWYDVEKESQNAN